MALSLIPQQRPEYRIHTLSIEEVLSLGEKMDGEKPMLENYFSPSKKESFVKDYLHFLNTSLLELRHGQLDLDLYLVFVLNFQFVAPLLEIPSEKELGLFYRVLEEKYDIDELDINLHFATSDYNSEGEYILTLDEGMIGEEAALTSFRNELDATYDGRREVKESVQKRLKQDGIAAVMKWQQKTGLPELAEAFGRSVVIPAFFDFTDKKLLGFYRNSTVGIAYEVAVPDFEEEK